MIEFHPQARDDLQMALVWYREKSAKASAGFLQRIEQALARLTTDPSSQPAIGGRFHYVRVTKFPFIVAYQIRSPDDVFIVADAHTSRRSGYWTDRA